MAKLTAVAGILCCSWCYLWWSSLDYPRDTDHIFTRICRRTIPPLSKSRLVNATLVIHTLKHTRNIQYFQTKLYLIPAVFQGTPTIINRACAVSGRCKLQLVSGWQWTSWKWMCIRRTVSTTRSRFTMVCIACFNHALRCIHTKWKLAGKRKKYFDHWHQAQFCK